MPYAPGIQDISGQLRARGLDTVGDSLSSAITNITQLKNQAKAMQAMFKAMTPQKDVLSGEMKPHPLGMTQDQFNALSWRDQIATMGGFIQSISVKSALQELAAKNQAEAERRTGEIGLGNLLNQLPENAGVPMDNLPIPAAMPARSGTGPPVSGLLGWPPSQARPNLIPGGYAAGLNPQSNPLAALTAQPSPDTTEAPIRAPGSAPGFSPEYLLAQVAKRPPAERAAILNSRQFGVLMAIAQRNAQAEERNTTQTDQPIIEQNLGGGYRGFRLPGSKQMDVRPDLAEGLHLTKPRPEDIPEGYIALPFGRYWKVEPDPTQFEETRTGLPGLDLTITKRYVGKRKTQPGQTTAQEFKKGDQVRQNGVLYEFDGRNWKTVK